jgi:predicted TIM-barrel fold metal-dependent hydrolase
LIVDIHVHPPGSDQPHEQFIAAVENMLDAGRRAGIDRQVFVGDTDAAGNERVRELVDTYPDQIIGFARGIRTDPNSPATIAKYVVEHGFKGVKLHNEQDLPLDALLASYPIYAKAAELGIPVLIHGFHEEEGLPADLHADLAGGASHFPVRLMGELGKRYPDTTFIFAHAGMMWDKAFQAAQPYPNVCLDMSGFDPERGIVEKAVETLGAERVLFGSDAPGRIYAAQLAKVLYADISEADKELVLGGNAARLLDLRG